MANHRPILMPIMRKILPDVMASDIVNVQPMSNPCGEIFLQSLDYTIFNQMVVIKREHINGVDWYVIRVGTEVEEWLKESFSPPLDFIDGDRKGVFYITERVYLMMVMRWGE